MENKFLYSAELRETPTGTAFKFKGPGMPLHANEVYFKDDMGKEFQQSEMNRILHMLRSAYEAGKEDYKLELRKMLGVR